MNGTIVCSARASQEGEVGDVNATRTYLDGNVNKGSKVRGGQKGKKECHIEPTVIAKGRKWSKNRHMKQ